MVKGKSLKKSLVWLLSLLMVLSLLGPVTLAAENNKVTVDLRVEGITENQLEKTSVEVEASNGAPTVMDVLEKASEDGLLSYREEGGFVTEINGEETAHFGGWDGWLYKVNRESPDVGAGEYTLEDGDKVVWYYGEMIPGTLIPEITIEPEEPGAEEGFTLLVTSSYEDWNTGDMVIEEIEDAVVIFEGEEYITDEEGKADIPGTAIPAAGTYYLKVHKDLEHPDSSVEDTFPYIVRTGDIPVTVLDADPDPDPEEPDIHGAIAKTVSWYQDNENPPGSWEGMPALWGAGENLNAHPWETTQDWRETDPGFAADTSGNEPIHYIFRLLSVKKNPGDIWEGRNLFAELAAQQGDDGSFGTQIGRHIWAIVGLDVGKDLGLELVDWEEENRQQAVQHLLVEQNNDGSFAPFSQLDHTGWSLIALSNYQGDEDVDQAIEDALDYLKGRQKDNAGFDPPDGAWGPEPENSNSNAAVLSGLVAVGEDVLDEDGPWVKNGNTIVDALLAFQKEDGSFLFTTSPNKMATVQSLLALVDFAQGESTRHRMGREIQFDPDPEPEPEPGKVTVNLSVEGIDDTILQEIEVDVEPTNNEPTALDALEQGLDAEGIDYSLEHYDWGVMVTSIANEEGGTFGGWDGWMYEVNGISPEVGADAYTVDENDHVLFYYSRSPEISTESVIKAGDEDPQVEVELKGDEFLQGAEDPENWSVDPGDTCLAVDSITKDDDQQATISFSGTAAAGTISIQARAAALGGDSSSNEITRELVEPEKNVLSVEADPAGVPVGENFTVSVNIENISNVQGYQVTIKYDPEYTEYKSHEVNFKPNDSEVKSEKEGEIKIGNVVLGDGDWNQDSGALVEIEFQSRYPGTIEDGVHEFTFQEIEVKVEPRDTSGAFSEELDSPLVEYYKGSNLDIFAGLELREDFEGINAVLENGERHEENTSSDGSATFEMVQPGEEYLLTLNAEGYLKSLVQGIAVSFNDKNQVGTLDNPVKLFAGDVNDDGGINLQDIALVASKYGQRGDPGWILEDINKDGVVDISDLAAVARNYNMTLKDATYDYKDSAPYWE